MTTLQIRAEAVSDAPLLVRLNQTVHTLHVEANPARYKPVGADEAARTAFFAGHIADANSTVFIAEAAGEPIGYVLCIVKAQVEGPFTTASSALEIDQLSVNPVWQRRGVASALTERAEQLAHERGIPQLTLSVAAFNTGALAFLRGARLPTPYAAPCARSADREKARRYLVLKPLSRITTPIVGCCWQI